jgi:hypothetical protein
VTCRKSAARRSIGFATTSSCSHRTVLGNNYETLDELTQLLFIFEHFDENSLSRTLEERVVAVGLKLHFAEA